MKKITLVISCALFSLSVSFGQDRKGSFVLEKGSESHELYVSFQPTLHFEGEAYRAVALEKYRTLRHCRKNIILFWKKEY
ncbi:hypothetical protein H9W95_18675 [Flavobacterium lindanitolerans]|nr:hypothetical protein [Flavobacterium lindanitolerans]